MKRSLTRLNEAVRESCGSTQENANAHARRKRARLSHALNIFIPIKNYRELMFAYIYQMIPKCCKCCVGFEIVYLSGLLVLTKMICSAGGI